MGVVGVSSPWPTHGWGGCCQAMPGSIRRGVPWLRMSLLWEVPYRESEREATVAPISAPAMTSLG